MTRGSITGQVKALSMIVAMQNFIPDCPTPSSDKNSPPAPIPPQIYAAAWRNQEEDSPAGPGVPWKPESAPRSAEEAPPNPGPSQANSDDPFSSSEASPLAPYVPVCGSVPDLGLAYPR